MIRENAVMLVSYNGAPSQLSHCHDAGCIIEDGHCIRATHAEANLIALAAREGVRTQGATIAVTHFPCVHCARLIIRSGFAMVYYIEEYAGSPARPLLEMAGVKVCQLQES